MSRCNPVLFLGLLICAVASTAEAASVYVIDNPSGLFSDGGLSQYGHSATIGPTYDLFDGTIDLSSYDVIVLTANHYALPDMPLAGQQAIVDFVANGGGLITGEWLTWRHSATGAFELIAPILPATTDGGYIGGAGTIISVNYAAVTPDPVLNAGLPDSMDVVVNGAGSEIITPRPGATVFYSGDSISPWYSNDGPNGTWRLRDEVFPSAGLVGWDHGLGRVLTFSTTLNQPAGPDYTDNYSRLVANAITWADASPAEVPEPGSLLLLGLGGLGVFGVSLRRRCST